MNRKTFFMFALSPLLIAACSQPQAPATGEPTAAAPEMATTDAATAAPTPPPAPAAGNGGLIDVAPSPVAPTSAAEAVTTYACKSGLKLDVVYPTTDSATLNHDGRAIMMKRAQSASGARYTGEGLEWWTKGSEGTLSRLQPDGTSGDVIESCASA